MRTSKPRPGKPQNKIETLTAQVDPPMDQHTSRIVLSIGARRYEFIRHAEVREISTEPGQLIQIPKKPAK